MADDERRGRRQIDTPEEALETLKADLRAGDAPSAIVIGDHLVRHDPANRDAVRGLYADALAGGLEHGKLDQRIWEMERAAGRHERYFSAAGQDRFVAETLLGGMTGGVFVDIGGHDGVTGSNTYFFETALAWTGVCIEASPTQFEKMARRRACQCLNAAVADFEGEAPFFEITTGYDQMSALTETMRGDFMGRFEVLRETTPSDAREITVPVTTFAAVAREHGLGRVDYCSIDVEGAELKVLEGIDFDETDIRVISVENPPRDAETFGAVRALLDGRGYRRARTLGDDDIFARD